jgi:hypothetical protein
MARLYRGSPTVKYAVVGQPLNDDPRYPLREDLSRNDCRVCLSTNDVLAGKEAASPFSWKGKTVHAFEARGKGLCSLLIWGIKEKVKLNLAVLS